MTTTEEGEIDIIRGNELIDEIEDMVSQEDIDVVAIVLINMLARIICGVAPSREAAYEGLEHAVYDIKMVMNELLEMKSTEGSVH